MIKLNTQQRSAVTHRGGPLLVIAGAGTGKTTVITERIKHIVAKQYAKTSEILALTFTEKASREMEERVDKVMPLGYTQMWISTFHSFCDRILRAEGLAIGLNTSYTLMTQGEAAAFIKKYLYDFELSYFRPLGNPTKFIYGLMAHFSRLQDEDVTPEEYYEWINGEIEKFGSLGKRNDALSLEYDKWRELAFAYKTYSDLKIQHDVMDFGDLITYTLRLFRERPNVLAQYQKKFKYILVDEYQDTNIAQNELVKLLAGKKANLTVVADDDQSIYKWRGAAVSNVVQFRNTFPKAKLVTLTTNYRSAQSILDASYDLIQFNNPDRLEVVEKIDKKLIAHSKAEGEIGFIHTSKLEQEAEEVALTILKLIETGHSYSDCAILVRANNHAEAFVKALTMHGIPQQFLGPGRLFDAPEILEIIAFLRFLYDPDDSLSFFTVLSIDEFNISYETLAKLSSHAKKKNISLYESCDALEAVKIAEEEAVYITNALGIIRPFLARAAKEGAGKLIYAFLEESKILNAYLSPETEIDQRKAENIALFFDKLKSFEVTNTDSGVRAVVEWIELLTSEGESPAASTSDWSENDAVNILTVHSAKGLEFPIVFLVNLVAQRFPTTNRSEQIPIPEEIIKEVLPSGDHHIQEERRLFYVGVTRAKEKLYLTAADFYGEGKRAKKLSPFIFEALGEDATAAEALAQKGSNDMFEKNIQHEDSKVSKATSLHVDYLSYSQVQTFELCPLHYKLNYILRVPSTPTAALSFGNAMHETMNNLYQIVKEGGVPKEKKIHELLENNWVSEGFAHKKHEAEYKKKGKEYLTQYLRTELKKAVAPLYLEFPFVSTLQSKKKGERNLKIGGKIDRINALSGGKIEIIDYKTGENVPNQKEVDKNEQLTFYALAASKLTDPNLGQKPGDIVLTLFYFEGMTKLTTTRTQGELDVFEERLFEIRKEIEESDFSCSGNYLCLNCEYKSICRA